MWYFWSLLLDDRVRLSRLIAIPSALLAMLISIYGIFAPDSFWIGTGLAMLFASLAIAVWKLGDWWKLRKALRQAQEGMPNRQRGFEVVADHPKVVGPSVGQTFVSAIGCGNLRPIRLDECIDPRLTKMSAPLEPSI